MELLPIIGAAVACFLVGVAIRVAIDTAKGSHINNKRQAAIDRLGIGSYLQENHFVPFSSFSEKAILNNKDLRKLGQHSTLLRELTLKADRKDDPTLELADMVLYVSMVDGKVRDAFVHPKLKEYRVHTLKEDMRKKAEEAKAKAKVEEEKAKADAEEARIQAIVDERLKNLK